MCVEIDGLIDLDGYLLLSDCALAVQASETLRGLILTIDSDGEDPDAIRALPDKLSHRSPSGSHGTAPIVQNEALTALYQCMKPTLALLKNRVCGSAIDIAAYCDIRVGRSDLHLQDDRVIQGRTASTGISYLLPRLIGLSQAMRISLLGETLSADELKRIHFLHEVVPAEIWADRQRAFVEQIAEIPTRAYEVHKLQVLPQLDLNHDAAMVHSLGIRQTHVIKDRQEGIQAWRERRPPKFTGQ